MGESGAKHVLRSLLRERRWAASMARVAEHAKRNRRMCNFVGYPVVAICMRSCLCLFAPLSTFAVFYTMIHYPPP